MGPTTDSTSVVAYNLTVIGIKNLRVIDASIMPSHVEYVCMCVCVRVCACVCCVCTNSVHLYFLLCLSSHTNFSEVIHLGRL